MHAWEPHKDRRLSQAIKANRASWAKEQGQGRGVGGSGATEGRAVHRKVNRGNVQQEMFLTKVALLCV